MDNNIANTKPNKDQRKEVRDREWHRLMQYIKSAQKQLDDGTAVPDYNIGNESTLHMMLRVGRGMHILVRTSGNITLVLQVELSDTIYDLKEKIRDMERIPIWEQRYVFRFRQLGDHETLADCGVEKGSTLYLEIWSRLLRGFVGSRYLPYVAYLRDSTSLFPNFYAWYDTHCY